MTQGRKLVPEAHPIEDI